MQVKPDDVLPPFVNPYGIILDALDGARPPRIMPVSDAAESYRFINNQGGGYVGPWRNDTVPYMVEPMNALISRLYQSVAFVGPAQSAKTDALILNWITHAVTCDPADMLIIETTRESARDFSMRRIDRLNRDTKMVGRRLLAHHNDNVHDKMYRGMMLNIMWPSITNLSGKPVPRVAFTDYDRLPQDINGEGDAFTLGRKRTTTFGSGAMTLAESSPGRPITSRNWKPATPHEAPPTTGILSLYNEGTRRRWYWPCPECAGYFEGSFALLSWPDNASPSEAAEQVVMICPHCGACIKESHKYKMNKAGRWVAEGQAVDDTGQVHGAVPKVEIDSYWLKGTAAAFASWGTLVSRYLTARKTFEATGSEETLKATINTDQAEPYLPAAVHGDELDPDMLYERAEDTPLAVVPEWVRFLIATVDIQINRFEVTVWGFGPALERCVIDDYAIFTTAEGDRQIDPGRHAEDWDLLLDVIRSTYPLEVDETASMPVQITAIDTGGAPGVTHHAYKFYHTARKAGVFDQKIMLVKGDNKGTGPIITVRREEKTQRGKVMKMGAPFHLLNTRELKDQVYNLLTNDTPGPGYVHLSSALPRELFDQLAGERKEEDKWIKIGRNDFWDRAVYAQAAAIKLDAMRIDWDNPPKWASPQDENPNIIRDLNAPGLATFGRGRKAPAKVESKKLNIRRQPTKMVDLD